MIVGTVHTFNKATEIGTVHTMDGAVLSFDYIQGQNLCLREDGLVPEFSGHHAQPDGFRLKLPSIGDAVIGEAKDGKLYCWLYMSHYMKLTSSLRTPSEDFL